MEGVGPIQLLCVAFDGNRFKGYIFPALAPLTRSQYIGTLAVRVARTPAEGRVTVMTASDLDWEEATSFGSYVGALAGFRAAGPEGLERGAIAGAAELADGHVFDEEDTFRVTRALPNNMSAALVLIEHVWAKPLLDAVARVGGMELSNDWISADEILTVSQDTAASDRD